jgi:hypothetical protein
VKFYFVAETPARGPCISSASQALFPSGRMLKSRLKASTYITGLLESTTVFFDYNPRRMQQIFLGKSCLKTIHPVI